MSAPPTPEALAEQLVAGQRGALARGITLLESQRAADRPVARRLLAAAQRLAPPASTRRIGITGSPGAGKSTLIEAYGTRLLDAGHRVAVLAIDPSSNRTRGSILGDKTRMATLSRDARAFVRPSPAGTTLGGVARATREAILLCEAAGYDRILVETVGVGQSEHAVRDLVDAMALLVLPGGGDDLQGIKRGIVELCDLVLVNKADGERAALARETARHYGQALHLQPARDDGWSPVAIAGSAVAAGGLTGFGESLKAYFEALSPSGLTALRTAQSARYFDSAWREVVLAAALSSAALQDRLQTSRDSIASGADTAESLLADLAARVHLRLRND